MKAEDYLAIPCLLLGAVTAMATTPMPSCEPNCWGPAVQGIEQALTVEDRDAKLATLRKAVRSGLSSDEEVRTEVLLYLDRERRWLPIDDLADIILEASRSDRWQRGPSIVDWHIVMNLSRDERLALYSAAMEKGSVALKHGTTLTAEAAARSAAVEGIGELRALIERSIRSPAGDREYYLAALELGNGGSTAEEAARFAVDKLADIPAEELRSLMKTKPGFDKAVVYYSKYICAVKSDLRCHSLWHIYLRQRELEYSLKRAAGPTGETPFAPDWLEHFYVATAPAAGFDYETNGPRPPSRHLSNCSIEYDLK